MKEQARGRCAKARDDRYFFSSPTIEFLDQEQPHPKNLKKITRQVPEGDPCGTPLALTLQRKMDVGLI